MGKELTISQKQIESRIFTYRGVQVMIDHDLAEMYQVEAKILNQVVKRNIDWFPTNFRFPPKNEEKSELVTNFDRFNTMKHSVSSILNEISEIR